MSKVSLVSNKNNNIDLIIEPIKGGPAFSEPLINELIKSSQYTELYVETSNIKNALIELEDVLKELMDKQKGRIITYEVLTRINASATITIDNDQMGASAEVTSAQGGKPLTAKGILAAAQKGGVRKGFVKEYLVSLAKEAAKEPAGTQTKRQIAVGKVPINGDDASIEPLLESLQNRVLKPKAREDGSVDMRNLGEIICVNPGDKLAKKIPLTQGVMGFKVSGIPLPAIPGKDIYFAECQGAKVSDTDSNILVSTATGVPRSVKNGMEVDDIYQVKNVGINTGNVQFDGSVIIDGDVQEGMTVVATGDVTIGGSVESATIESGGDITISGGIIGRQFDIEKTNAIDVKMSTNITAKGSIFAKYCQYSKLTCQENIRVENQLMHSQIDVGGQLWVGVEDRANGKLIGGHISAVTSVSAGVVGATAGSKTVITFEKSIIVLQQKIHDIEKNAQQESDTSDIWQSKMMKIKKIPKKEREPDAFEKATKKYQHHANAMGKLLSEKDDAENELHAYMNGVSVTATNVLYQDVELIVGDFHDRSRREYGPSKMIYDKRKIHIDAIIHRQ